MNLWNISCTWPKCRPRFSIHSFAPSTQGSLPVESLSGVLVGYIGWSIHNPMQELLSRVQYGHIKLKLSHYTPRRRLGVEEVQLLLILDLGTKWGWVVSVTLRPRFIPEERTPATHCTGGWVNPRAGLDTEVRGNILLPLQGVRTPIAR
jgi:hypothetical protein